MTLPLSMELVALAQKITTTSMLEQDYAVRSIISQISGLMVRGDKLTRICVGYSDETDTFVSAKVSDNRYMCPLAPDPSHRLL